VITSKHNLYHFTLSVSNAFGVFCSSSFSVLDITIFLKSLHYLSFRNGMFFFFIFNGNKGMDIKQIILCHEPINGD
jgi:hypothetical protein